MNKVVIITGGGHGIGLATAKRLLNEGYVVYAGAKEKGGANEIRKLGGHILEIELEDEDSLSSSINRVVKEQGVIDVLINNAGWGHYGPIEEVSSEVVKRTMQTNLFGPARLTQLVLPYMREAGAGTIINISSIAGKIYFPLGGWYHASKHALEAISDSLRIELEPLGIKVIIIEPGIIDTGFNEAMIQRIGDLKSCGGYEGIKNAMLGSLNPNNPGSKPEIVARTISKVLSKKIPRARYKTGRLARPLINLRRILGDRVFDILLRRWVKGLTNKSNIKTGK